MTKQEALRKANVFTPTAGGIMFPHDMDNPEGPYTMAYCADAEAKSLARRMRVGRALELLGYSPEDAEGLSVEAADWGGSARDILNRALRIKNGKLA